MWIIGGVRLIGSTRTALALLAEPVVAVGVAAIVLGQRLSAAELAGGASILLTVVLVQRAERPGTSASRSRAADRNPWIHRSETGLTLGRQRAYCFITIDYRSISARSAW